MVFCLQDLVSSFHWIKFLSRLSSTDLILDVFPFEFNL